MYDIRDIFRAIPIDREERRPIIGVVGEIYVRLHQFCNQEIVRQIEELGGEARVAPFGEWIHYQTDRYIANGKRDWKLYDIFAGSAFHSIQEKDEKKLLEPFRDDLLDWEEPTTKEVLDLSEEYMHPSFEGEAILSIGKAVDYAKKGSSGILNIIPFSCMPGMIVNAISKKIREQNGNIPWLNIDYDGMDENNGRSRLEAFIYQASQYRKKDVTEVAKISSL